MRREARSAGLWFAAVMILLAVLPKGPWADCPPGTVQGPDTICIGGNEGRPDSGTTELDSLREFNLMLLLPPRSESIALQTAIPGASASPAGSFLALLAKVGTRAGTPGSEVQCRFSKKNLKWVVSLGSGMAGIPRGRLSVLKSGAPALPAGGKGTVVTELSELPSNVRVSTVAGNRLRFSFGFSAPTKVHLTGASPGSETTIEGDAIQVTSGAVGTPGLRSVAFRGHEIGALDYQDIHVTRAVAAKMPAAGK